MAKKRGHLRLIQNKKRIRKSADEIVLWFIFFLLFISTLIAIKVFG